LPIAARYRAARARQGDIAVALREQQPWLVVDASGPFQAMDYAVPQACIAAGVHYCDIADGRSFVSGIDALDETAREAGVCVISGASSVPALSGAIVRLLAQGAEQVTAVEMAISASNRATAGPSVSAAILSQVGQPFTRFEAGRWTEVRGWQKLVREEFSACGVPPIRRRLVGDCDVPDLALLPGRLPGRPAVIFRAGTELGFQNRALQAADGWRAGACSSVP
jgi:saccharopine dehydrogenase-like NADP-dependent oxidoreductase